MRALGSLALILFACGGGAEPPAPPQFNADRAFAELRELVSLGPRHAGSQAAARARALLTERLRQAGWRVEEQAFRAGPPQGPERDMVNLIAHRSGAGEAARILLGTHYDTKLLPDAGFVGANDGASGAALLLELARQLATRPRACPLELVFFDGEEAFGSGITASDGLYGSRAYVARELEQGRFASIGALILVDMIGDRDLNLTPDLSSHPELRAIVSEEALRLGNTDLIDFAGALHVVDDHTPFQEAGLEDVLALIDFQFGARSSPGPYWHTSRDELSAVSAESLNTVGTLVVQVLERVEARLLERAPAP